METRVLNGLGTLSKNEKREKYKIVNYDTLRMPRMSEFFHDMKSVLTGNILLLFITWILLMFGGNLTSNFASLYYRALGASDVIIGIISSLSFVTMAALQLIGGSLADSIGRKKMISTFTFMFALSILLFAFAPSWQVIVIAVIVSNLSLLYQPALFSVMMDSLPEKRRATGFAITNVPLLFAMVAPVVGGYFVHQLGIVKGMRLNYLLFFLLALTAAFLRLGIGETLQIKKKNYSIQQHILKSIAVWKNITRKMYYLLYSGITLNFVNGLTMAFLVLYATTYVDTVYWGIMIGILIATQVFLGLVVGYIADRTRKERFLVSGFLFLSLASLLFAFKNPYLLPIFAVLRGAGLAMQGPSQNALIADYVPLTQRGRVMGSYLFFSYLGGTVGGIFGGLIYRTANYLPFLIGAVLLALIASFLSIKLEN